MISTYPLEPLRIRSWLEMAPLCPIACELVRHLIERVSEVVAQVVVARPVEWEAANGE